MTFHVPAQLEPGDLRFTKDGTELVFSAQALNIVHAAAHVLSAIGKSSACVPDACTAGHFRC